MLDSGSRAQSETHAGRRFDRALWAIAGVGALAVLAIARALSPDPSGVGTHTQLGLPPCAMLALTSLPCPTCGLTTAFAHMARLELRAAVHAHILGIPLFLLDAAIVPLSLYGFVRDWPVRRANERLHLTEVAAIIACAALLAWIVRLSAILLG